MKHLITLLILIALATTSSGQWTKTNGPEGGAGYGIFEFSGKLFAATLHGMYVSNDNAASWQSAGLSEKQIYRTAAIGSSLFAAVDDTLFRSNDQGASWEMIKIFGRYRIQDMTVEGTTLFLSVYAFDSTAGGIYRTNDKGNSWSRITETNVFKYVRSLCRSGQYLFAATYRDGIYRTSNQGNSWEKLTTNLLVNPNIWTLQNFNDTLYAAGVMCFFYSTNNGSTWIIPQNKGLDSIDNTFAFYTLGKTGKRIFATMLVSNYLDTVCLFSDDNGKNWHPRNSGSIPSTVDGFSYSSIGNILYEQNHNGIFRTSNQGNSWTAHNSGVPHLPTGVGFSHAGSLFSFGPTGIYSTSNGGTSWVHIESPSELRWKPLYGSVEFQGSTYIWENSLWKYNGTWSKVDDDYTSNIVPFQGGLLRLSYEILFSINGSTWETRVPIGIPDTLVMGSLFSGGSSVLLSAINYSYDSLYIYRTTDGINWDKVYSQSYDGSIQATTVHKGVVYLSTYTTPLLRSDDGGLTWENDNAIDSNSGVTTLYSMSGHLFASVQHIDPSLSGLFIRKENSEPFSFVGHGLPEIYSLHLHSDGYLYAGTDGVWKRSMTELGVSEPTITEPMQTLRPNPATDYIIVDEDATVTLFSSTGAEVFTTKATQDERIALPKLASGVYIAKIETKSGTKTAKVVVQ